MRRTRGENQLDDKYTRRVVKHPGKVMVWMSCSHRGPGKLSILQPRETMNAETFQATLERMKPLPGEYLLMDRAPAHTAKSTLRYLKQHRIKAIYIPPNSPDCNPIENAFSMMKHRLLDEDTSNTQKLKTVLPKCWRKIPSTYFSKICLSMKRRLQEVVRAGGGSTHY